MADTSITREERYLEYLTGDRKGNVPKPVTRRERYLYELCLKGIGGEISPEEIKNAVNEYLEKNPVKPGATTEQVQQIEQNKTDIVSLKTETSSLKEDLSTKISKFYASSQGETHLADSDNGKIQNMMIYGRSEQKQYSGKNLVDASKVITGDLQEGIVGNGNNYITDYVEIDDSEEYIISGCLKSNYENGFYDENKQFTRRDFNYTIIPQKGEKYVRIEYVNNGDKKIMLEKGSKATSYEPYTGGIPSPNPDYPQEIKSVVNPAIKICGKNLLNYKETIINGPDVAGIEFVENGFRIYTKKDVVYCSSKTYLDFSKLRIGETYTLSANLLIVKGVSRLTIRNRANTIIADSSNITESGTYKISFTLTDQMYYVSFFATFDAVASGDVIVTNIQLEKGSVATPFEPYHEQTVTLPYTLNAIPVSSGGNVTIDGQQYIADYVDVERGKLVRMVSPVVVSDSEYITGNNNSHQVRINKYIKNTTGDKIGIILCDKLRPASAGDVWNGVADNIVSVHNGDPRRLTFRCTTKANDMDSALKFIKSCKIYIALAEPEEIDLATEEIAAFKSLATYYPTTNIFINSEQLDGYTVFNYPISMANGWNYVKKQLNDNRDYIYDMDIQSAEAYVNSEYAVALTELEV